MTQCFVRFRKILTPNAPAFNCILCTFLSLATCASSASWLNTQHHRGICLSLTSPIFSCLFWRWFFFELPPPPSLQRADPGGSGYIPAEGETLYETVGARSLFFCLGAAMFFSPIVSQRCAQKIPRPQRFLCDMPNRNIFTFLQGGVLKIHHLYLSDFSLAPPSPSVFKCTPQFCIIPPQG